ncbi:MAG: peroxiredoxin family protein [Novosphingobium sp.]
MILLVVSLLARLVLAVVFVVAGLTKLADTDRTREMLVGFGVRRGLLGVAAFALPLAELAVAAALLVPPAAFGGALAAAALLALFTGAIAFNLAKGRHPDCNCFGQIGSTPIGPATLLRNVLLTAMALLVVVAGPQAAAVWRLDRYFGVTPLSALAGGGAVVALLLLLLIAAAQLTILHRLSRVQVGTAAGGPVREMPGESRGLPEGSLAPSFGLSDTRGAFVTLEQLLAPGRRVILLFVKTDCPPCVAMADEVDRWQTIHSGLLDIVRISDGVAAVEHYALLQLRGELAQAYDCWGTPCAVLVNPDGRIGSAAAQGAAAIRALVRRTVVAATIDDIKTA